MATRIVTKTKRKKAKYFIEDINGVPLDMILIPPGSFTMGAEKEEELSRNSSERPTHRVTIAKPFFMGRYPITQGQWKAVFKLPQVGKELTENPSRFFRLLSPLAELVQEHQSRLLEWF
jgi:formylglycine-generating enzyme required for sulfatase activity